MDLRPGTRLGAYDITAPIGEGGMGQVYRATDAKLKRHVAIKVLPPSLAADADRRARFQREAEVRRRALRDVDGRRLFDGGTVSDVLAAVLRQDVDLDALPAGTTPEA